MMRNALAWGVLLLVAVLPVVSASGLATASVRGFQPEGGVRFAELMVLALDTTGRSGSIDDFWRRTFPALSGTQPYTSPSDFVPYDGDNPAAGRCPQRSENAAYCAGDKAITWDQAWFDQLFAELGATAPLAILAHEWGHHIQALLALDEATPDLQVELQADCYAGLYFADASKKGALPSDAVLQGVLALFLQGSSEYLESEWFDEQEHGPPAERAQAFNSGYFGSYLVARADPTYCLDFTRYESAAPVKVGSYAFHLPPGTDREARAGGGLRLVHAKATTEIVPRPDLGANPARDQFGAVRDAYFQAARAGGATTQPLDNVEDVFAGTLGGSAVAQHYEQTRTENGTTRRVHGVLALHIAEAGGGLVLDVAAPGDTGWQVLFDHLFVLALSTCAPGGPLVAACLFSEMAWWGLPEVVVRAAPGRLTVEPATAAPGRTLITFVHDPEVDAFQRFLLVKLAEGLDRAAFPPPPGADEPPAWFYRTTLVGDGHPSVLPRGRSRVVADLSPGRWAVTADPAFWPVSNELMVAGVPAAATPGREPAAEVEVTARDFAYIGLDGSIAAGHQVWKVNNRGPQPHELVLFRFSAPVTAEQVTRITEAIRQGGQDPTLTAEVVGAVTAQSAGQTVWVEFDNLVPGYYAAVCFLPDEATGRRHEALGMVEVFTVGDISAAPG